MHFLIQRKADLSPLLFLQVSYRSLQDRVLKITVYDVDRHRRHNVVGHALYPLKDHDAESNERLVMWRDLEREVTEVRQYYVRE